MGLDYEIFKLGNVRLQRGGRLPDCKLAYKTFGKMSAAKDNVIVYPTWYSGQHPDNEWLIGPGMALDPENTSSSSRTCWATACPRRRAMCPRPITGRVFRA
jgi:homoserine acetyltransferase